MFGTFQEEKIDLQMNANVWKKVMSFDDQKIIVIFQ